MNTAARLPLIVPNSAARMKSIAKRLGILVSGIGCLVLFGWIFDIAELKSILPGLATMKSMTATLFVLAGMALLLQAEEKSQQVVRACAFIIALIAALTLGEYVFKFDFGIDQLLFRDTAPGSLFPGRMSPVTALSFLLVGLSFYLGETPMRIRFKDTLLIAVFAISMLALIGYLYSVSSLYQIGVFTSMAVHTAVSFIVLATGILLARPEQGLIKTILAETAGGSVLRRFLPVAVGLPIILGWIRLLGQRAGLYDTAFGLAIMVIALITALTISIWVNAQQLTQIDWKRQQAHDALSESETRLRTTIEGMAEGYQIVGYDWRHLYVNQSAARNTQLSREQLLGRTMMECFPGIEKHAMFGALRECMEARVARQIQTEYKFPNGTKGWFDINVQPVPDGILILSSDITERKQAELALQEREMQLSKLFEILPVGISILNAERRITYSNPALKKILHLSEKDLQQGTYTKRTYMKTDGTPMAIAEMASTLAFRENRQIDAVETGIVIEDGSTIWTSVSAVPMDIQDWKLVLVTVDITDHRQAEERFRFAIESAPNAVIMTDEHGKMVLVNSAAEKYFGYQRTELMMERIDILVPERFRGAHANHRAGFFSQPQARAMGVGRDLYGLRKDGNEFPVEIGLAPISAREGMLVLATIVDITERKKREEETRKLEERFSIAFRASPVGLTITTLADGTFVDVNESYLQMLGYHREEVIGHTSVELNMLSAEERAKPLQQLRKQGRIRNVELQLRAKSGRLFNVLFSSEQIELNGIACVLTIVVDISDRKQAEEEILKLNANLERKVAERTDELAAANKKLHELSIVDELTGLYNRRGFLLLAEEQFLLAKRTQCNLSIFYADLDNLKQINDQYGHAAGDEAIASAADALLQTFRISDIKARLGGDEFIVLAVEAEGHHIPTLLTRLQETLAEKNQSMSVGVISFDPQNELSIEELIIKADKAMYEAKLKKPGRHTR